MNGERELVLYAMLGAIIGMVYALRRVIILEQRIIGMERRIMDISDNLVKLVKKKKR